MFSTRRGGSRAGGAFVAAHYVPRMGSILNGDEVHSLLAMRTRLTHVVAERTEFGERRACRIDRFEQR
jgi:hypothetical protein